MQNFEISHSLTDIAQIWEAFFDPIVNLHHAQPAVRRAAWPSML